MLSNHAISKENTPDFFIDSTKSTACNICLAQDLCLEAQKALFVQEAAGENYEQEQLTYDSLVDVKAKIIATYKLELGKDSTTVKLEKWATTECLKNYSFQKRTEKGSKQVLVNFDAYYRRIHAPIPQKTIFDLDDFVQEDNGKYIYRVQGKTNLLSAQELELQFNQVIEA
jgi:hypothetical protein